jgi:hypothetical protein
VLIFNLAHNIITYLNTYTAVITIDETAIIVAILWKSEGPGSFL